METSNLNMSLDSVAGKMGIPTDMFIFFLGEAVCLGCAFLYHRFLPARRSSTKLRHWIAMVLGILIGFFSFGREFFHVILQSSVCYILLQILPSSVLHWATFVIAMSYLVGLHLYRAFMIPEDVLYSIDVSGPLMIVTQKITSLAFGLYDGCHGNKDKLSDLQKRYMISKPPSGLEYFSYIFHFQGVVVGPLSFYTDYIAYVEGTNLVSKGKETNGVTGYNNNNRQISPPSPYKSVAHKLFITLFWMGFHFTLKPLFPEMKNSDPLFIQSHGILYRLWYMLFSMLCCRAKYYVAFSLGDAISNASGLGFNGYDTNGQSKWDLITNVHIFGIEGATSPKSYLDNWNIQTAVWLRHVCYDRIRVFKRFCTFFLSAMWHGCYPGYYFTFISGAMVTEVSRRLRRRVRPYFIGSVSVKMFYDILTWLLTHMVISYIAVPFTVLHFWPTVIFFNSLYWSVHIIPVLLLFILPFIPRKDSGKGSERAGEPSDMKNGITNLQSQSANGVKKD